MRKTAAGYAGALAAIALSLLPTEGYAQGAEDAARAQSASGLTLTAEPFCSETKLRTANVGLRWTLSPEARATTKLAAFTDAKQTLDATVYAGGFEKGLYVSLPVPSAAVAKPVAAVAPPAGPARQTPVRAFQIRLIEAGSARTAAGAIDSGEFRVVVEDLEPGVNYTWRLTLDAPSGRLVSAPVSIQAPTCPADMVQPTKKTPPKKGPGVVQ